MRKIVLKLFFILSSLTLLIFCNLLYQVKVQTPTCVFQCTKQEYMKEPSITHYTKTGAIKYRIHASYWTYLPKQEHSLLTQLKMQIFKENGSIWYMQSETGIAYQATLNRQISQLDLNRKVHIYRKKTYKFIPVLMKSEHLKYFPEKDFIETVRFVEIQKPGINITGIGLKGNLKNCLELFSKVRTHYETTSS